MSPRICAGVRKDGTPCRTVATADGYCFATWCEWLQGQIRDKHPGGLDTLTDEQMNEYLAQVEAKFLAPAGGEG